VSSATKKIINQLRNSNGSKQICQTVFVCLGRGCFAKTSECKRSESEQIADRKLAAEFQLVFLNWKVSMI
jgi:hypothetical protein